MVQLVVNNGTQNGVINSKPTSSRDTHPTTLRADEVIVISYNTAAYIIKGQGNGHGAERQMGKRREKKIGSICIHLWSWQMSPGTNIKGAQHCPEASVWRSWSYTVPAPGQAVEHWGDDQAARPHCWWRHHQWQCICSLLSETIGHNRENLSTIHCWWKLQPSPRCLHTGPHRQWTTCPTQPPNNNKNQVVWIKNNNILETAMSLERPKVKQAYLQLYMAIQPDLHILAMQRNMW